jgi:hypothetical protein
MRKLLGARANVLLSGMIEGVSRGSDPEAGKLSALEESTAQAHSGLDARSA